MYTYFYTHTHCICIHNIISWSIPEISSRSERINVQLPSTKNSPIVGAPLGEEHFRTTKLRFQRKCQGTWGRSTSARNGGVVGFRLGQTCFMVVSCVFFTEAKIVVYYVYRHIYHYFSMYLSNSIYLSISPPALSAYRYLAHPLCNISIHLSMSPSLSLHVSLSYIVSSYLTLSYHHLMYGIFTLFTYMILQACIDLASSFHSIVPEASEKRCQKVMPWTDAFVWEHSDGSWLWLL